MAQFDQPVQDRVQPATEYTRLSKPISDPKPISPEAKAFEGIDTAITKGTEDLNKFAEKRATDVGYEAGEKIQGDYGASVQALYENTFPNKNGDTLTPSTGSTGFDESKVPSDVKDRVAQLSNVRAAREQGGLPGHIRETEYYKQLYMKASELRSQWPGYRDYIDKGIEKATGISPNANSYIKSMLADLNEAYNKKNEEKNKFDSKLAEFNNWPGVPDLRDHVNAGHMTLSEGWHELGRITAIKANAEVAKSAMEIHAANKQDYIDRGTAALHDFIPGVASSAIKGAITSVFPTSESMDNATDEQWQLAATKVKLAKSQVEQRIDAEFGGRKGPNGKIIPGLRDQMGDEYDKVKKNAMAEFDSWDKIITDHDSGMATAIKRSVASREDSMKYAVLKGNNQLDNWLKSMWFLKEFGGSGFQFQAATVPGATPPGTNPKRDAQELQVLLGSAAGNVQIGGIDTIKSALGLIDKENKGKSPESAGQHINDIYAGVQASSANVNTRANLIHYTFGFKDRGWLGLINDDMMDPKTGNIVGGKHSVYEKFADPEFIQSIKEVASQTGSRKLLDEYHEWMKDAFKNNVVPEDLNQLQKFQDVKGMVLKLHKNNGQAPQFEVIPGGNQARQFAAGSVYGVPPTTASSVQYTIHNLNSALKSLYNVEDENTWGTFMEMLDQRGINTVTTTGIPQNALDSLVLSIGVAGGPKDNSTKDQNRVGSQLSPTIIPEPTKPSVEDIQAAHKAEIARDLAARRTRESVRSK